jgi:signal transduction histidine kinase
MTSTVARQKKEQEWTLKAVLSGVLSGVICTDTQWMVTQINPTAEVLTGVLCSEGIGKPLEKCLRIIDRKSRKSIDTLIAKSRLELVNWELDNLVLLDRDRNEIPIRFKVSPIENERDIIIGFAIILDRLVDRENQELVRHKPTEIELQRLNLELETRAHQRSEDFLAVNSQLVIALEEKGRIELQLRRHLERLKLTYQMAFDLDHASTLQQVYQVAIAAIKQIFQAHRSAISIQDEHGHLRFQISDGLSRDFIEIAEEFCIQSFCSDNIEPTIVSDIETFAQFDPIRDAFLAEGFKSVGMFVLSYQERTFGEICFGYNRTHDFSEEEVQLGKAIAAYIAMAISRKQAQEKLEKNEAALAEAQRIARMGNWEYDVTTEQVTWSDRLFDLWGFSCDAPEPDINEILERIDPEDRLKLIQNAEASIATNSPFESDFKIYLPDRSSKWLYCKGHYILDGDRKPTKYFGIAQDITERKQAEGLRLELEREKEINELRIRFFSMMSHEFRTPLAVIINASHLLKLTNERLENKSIQKQVNYIESSAKRLVTIMDNVLTINRAEVGKLEFNPQPLLVDRYCRQIVTEMTLSIGNQQRIHYHNHCQIQKGNLDRRLLDSILSNLLSNALKYSPEHTTVTLGLNCHAAAVKSEAKNVPTNPKRSKTQNETLENPHIVFQISDRGIGISESDLKHIFDPFYRAKNAEKSEGTGLGLSIVKQYVKAHGGTITVKSEIGVGTTFTVTLPL